MATINTNGKGTNCGTEKLQRSVYHRLNFRIKQRVKLQALIAEVLDRSGHIAALVATAPADSTGVIFSEQKLIHMVKQAASAVGLLARIEENLESYRTN